MVDILKKNNNILLKGGGILKEIIVIPPAPPPPPLPSEYYVYGGIVPDANGTYFQSGIKDGKYYFDNGNGYYLYYESVNNAWEIDTQLGGQTPTFSDDGTSNDAPTDSIWVTGSVTGPAPIVSETPHGDVLYATDDQNLYTVDTSTGAKTLIGSLNAFTVRSLVWDYERQIMWGAYSNTFYAIDLNTGEPTSIGEGLGTISAISDMAVDRYNSSKLYFLDTGSRYLNEITDPFTPSSTEISTSALPGNQGSPPGFALGFNGVLQGTNGATQFDIDSLTGGVSTGPWSLTGDTSEGIRTMTYYEMNGYYFAINIDTTNGGGKGYLCTLDYMGNVTNITSDNTESWQGLAYVNA